MTPLQLFLRLGRWGTAGFSVIAFATIYIQTAAYFQIVGHSATSRAAFAQSITTIATHFTVVFPPPVRPDTAGGYVEWRGFHALALLLAIWAVVSATAMVRVDEEHGIIEAVLATGCSRVHTLLARTAAFVSGVGVASAAAALAFWIGVAVGGESVDARGVVQAALLLALLAFSIYGLSLLFTQLFATRGATAVAAIVVLSLFLVDSLSRVFTWLSTARWISPFTYYDLNDPLPPGGNFDGTSALVLLSVFAVATAAAALAFARRDLRAPLLPIPTWRGAPSHEPSDAPWWRLPLARELYVRRFALLAWCAGVAALAVLLVSVTKTALQPLLSIPTLFPNFGATLRGNIFPTLLGFTWFNFAELIFAALAVTYVARWSAEDTDGRLEAILGQPRSRAGVVVERMTVLVVGATLIAAVSGFATFYASQSQGLPLDGQRVEVASLMLVPLAVVFAAVGSLLAAWKPRAAVGLLGGVAFLSFLDSEVGPILRFPSWVQDLSPFKLFGAPLLTGLDGRNLALLLLLACAGVGSSILLMQRRDIGA
jgi:ABC-2 type transport system permease protein